MTGLATREGDGGGGRPRRGAGLGAGGEERDDMDVDMLVGRNRAGMPRGGLMELLLILFIQPIEAGTAGRGLAPGGGGGGGRAAAP
jgi:hypothetical protein